MGWTVLGVAAAAVAFGAWALASPVGSAPDDDFHLASLWCAPSASADFCEPVVGTDTGEVRVAVSSGVRCFVIDESASGACTVAALADERSATTDRANFTGYNPEGYYLLLGPLAGEDITASVLTVRAVNATLFLAIVLSAFLLLPAARRPALVWGLLLTLVPAGMHLIPSTNPQSWVFGAAAITALAGIGALEMRGWRRWALVALAIAATGVAMLARGDAALVAGLSVAVVLLARFVWSRRAWPLLVALGGLLLVAAVGWFAAGQTDQAVPVTGRGPLEVLTLTVTNALAMPILWYRVLGGPVGWQDVPLSPVVGIVGGLRMLAAVVTVLRVEDRRMRWAIWLVILALWVVPLYMLVNHGDLVGMYVQPRYIAPMVVLLGTLVLLRGPAMLRLPAPAAWSIAGALAVAHSVALHGVIRRYVTGTDVSGFDLDAGAEWWWLGAPSPMTVWAIGSIGWAVLLAAAVPLIARVEPTRLATGQSDQKRTSTSDAS